jgi:integrase/recombinase XerD
MTKILHRDPDRRCKGLGEWPEPDRVLWQAALVPGDLLDDGGSRAGRSEYSNRNAVNGYGRWLSWLDRQGLLETTEAPADRIIPTRVNAYIADLEEHNATQTLLNRLQELQAVAVVMDPDRDWSWLNRMYSRVLVRHRPARLKRPRLVPSQELFELGTDLMARAEEENTACARALAYRDGLIIALLAARPLRLRNLVGLVLDHTLVTRGRQWWIEFPASEIKTKEPIELPWPEPLVPALEIYLVRHRDVLAGFRRESARLVGGALWISKTGSPMCREAIYGRITARTRDAFGRSINPHLFRDAATTTVAIDDPRHVGIAAPLLGHRSAATTEKYYNQASSVEACRSLQNFLLSVRRGEPASSEDPCS